MATPDPVAGEWAIELIPVNDTGRAFYLQQYKPFRLAALKQDAEAFGSTYAREAAFPDETWLQRLSNPRVKTFVAVRLHDRRILSAVSLVGPMHGAEQTVSNPTRAVLSQARPSDCGNSDAVLLLYQNTGVYTRPEARGKGLGLRLMATAGSSSSNKQQCRLGVEVYKTNHAAIAFYQKCGFEVTAKAPGSDDDEKRPEACMYYKNLLD
ncbi:uncharacterized protein PG998_001905 [Apiospora kogelbergensis]|uniref:uncharacterized protein n=1 Tax=Apiospora kogelbergensis TaxID=1337665 RepID=UPI0031307017